MPVHNEVVKVHNFLSEMYKDSYFPDFLVDKIKGILVDMCEQIESTNPSSDDELFKLTHAATERINELEEEFEENDIELETAARENIAEILISLLKLMVFQMLISKMLLLQENGSNELVIVDKANPRQRILLFIMKH